MRAVKLIGAADAIVYDDLGCEDALSYAQPTAELVYVGKRGGKAESLKQPQIDRIIVDLCSQGKQVVRLKGGCPAVFSRVASEMSALAAASIPYELVPGVSSALAAPLFAGFPLTHVSLSNSFTVVSGHDVAGTNWAAFRELPTLVVLMAGRNLGQIARRLVEDAGWAPDTPVAVIRSAGLPEQHTWLTSLDTAEVDLAEAGQLSPCIVVVGKVAATGNLA
ncbi:hypothetical protein HXX76_015843 [Chlamydomonas incerta]|uniref:Tetrapyrrole methylase domain-containing protein n=1 Tax=Chlamydomonas incerta TaxID=51695 RepID=A0A835S9A1_CHLIN|nr:hypothetical protein HXX76_015843 [Chlamydomonas incerta]|eukprot:KAG2422679.1 hypothetical protein HXX76_015843 [Chlamydomonas incerta]